MDIESIYGAYLKHQETLRERDKYVFHASSAGSCIENKCILIMIIPLIQKMINHIDY